VKSYNYDIAVRWYRCHTPKVLFRGLIAELGIFESGKIRGASICADAHPF
jgi:hypothetical protein